MAPNSEDKSFISRQLGIVFIILILIILVLNFAGLRILDSTHQNLKKVTHNFQHLQLLSQLDSLINRQLKEVADFIILGEQEVGELEKSQTEIIATFKKIKSLDHEHHIPKNQVLENEYITIADIEKNYLVLNEKIKRSFKEWETTGKIDSLHQLQLSLEEDFEEGFLNFFEEVISQEMQEVEMINRKTHEDHEFEVRLAWSLIGLSVIFSLFAFRKLRASMVSRQALESSNQALLIEIEEKEDAEKKVYLERENLYNILDSLPMAFHLQAPDYTVPFANKVFRELFGDPQKRKCYDLMHQRTQPCEVCEPFRVFDHKNNETSIWQAQNNRTYITVCTPFTDIDGSPLVMEMALDITEQEAAKKEAIQAREVAEKASKAKSEFLTNMSHELRTPMNAILGFSQLLEMEQENSLNALQQDQVQHILKAGKHLLELINDVLDLSRIEAGHISLSIEEFHTTTLISEIFELLQPLLNEKNLSFEVLPQKTSGLSVIADRVRLKQVLLNIVSNAIKYNRPGGSVSITIRKLEDKKISISIQDTGIGISPENLGEIFKPFQRIESNMAIVEGTGIGLTISRKLVELMNCSLEAQSEEGKGSCFSITLPEGKGLLPLEEAEFVAKPDSAPIKNKENNFQVLYIEDNPANMDLVASILFRHKLKLLQAPDANLGIELAKAHKPDLILMDINLPGINGYEALKIIQTEPSLASVPVIALSAHSMESDIKKGLSAGFSDYICKPIEVRTFLKIVNHFLP
jgi:signal transduction histidine kinase